MPRNTQTREGYEFWDRLNAIPHYGFLLNQQGNGVVRAEGVGDWIERHPAQVVVDDAQTEVNVLREESAKLQAEIVALKADNESLRKDAERWRFVRNPVGNGSPFAVWSERTNLFLGKCADKAIDDAMIQATPPLNPA